MAKLRSLFTLEGTFGNVTHVQSRTYGEHIRAPRGTHKPALINEAFKSSGAELLQAYTVAKLIKDGIDPYRADFKGGLLWQRLVSLFKKQFKEQGGFDLSALQGFEVWLQYPMMRFFQGNIAYEIRVHEQNLEVNIRLPHAPDFKRKFVNGYRLGMIVLFPEPENKTCPAAEAYTPVISLKETPGLLNFKFPLSGTEQLYAICLKVEACENERVAEGVAVKGMCFVGGGC